MYLLVRFKKVLKLYLPNDHNYLQVWFLDFIAFEAKEIILIGILVHTIHKRLKLKISKIQNKRKKPFYHFAIIKGQSLPLHETSSLSHPKFRDSIISLTLFIYSFPPREKLVAFLFPSIVSSRRAELSRREVSIITERNV